MIDWSCYSIKPNDGNLQKYPTIVDLLQDIMEYEEEHLHLTKYPLSCSRTELYEMEEPGHYFVMQNENDTHKAVLYPTGRNPMTFYRGESKCNDTCIPSLLRTNDKETILRAHLQTAELECILYQHPVIREFLMREINCTKLSEPFKITVPFGGLAQHYGILSPYLDLTNDKWVASFFAITNYNKGHWDVVIPSKHQQYGSIYRLANVNFREKTLPLPNPIGLQYFNRPGKQSAFMLDMSQMKDLNTYPAVERIYFRHDTEANQLVYDLCQQGRKFLPSDSLVGLVEQLKETKKFSIQATEKTRITHYPQKNNKEMHTFLEKYGLDVVESPVVGFAHQEIQQEWKEWQQEGAQRFLTKLMVIPTVDF